MKKRFKLLYNRYKSYTVKSKVNLLSETLTMEDRHKLVIEKWEFIIDILEAARKKNKQIAIRQNGKSCAYFMRFDSDIGCPIVLLYGEGGCLNIHWQPSHTSILDTDIIAAKAMLDDLKRAQAK